MYIRVISDYKYREVNSDKFQASVPRDSKVPMCYMLATTRFRRRKGSSCLSMASSVYESDTLYSNKCKLQHPVSIQEPA